MADQPVLSDPHAAALGWFQRHAGQEVTWPQPLDGLHLVNKAKGIHKPAGWIHALSIRQSLSGPYDDLVGKDDEGLWTLSYSQEGDSPDLFTNQALDACRVDGIPVGVIVQTQPRPNQRYLVMGLGTVEGYSEGVFSIRQYLDGFGQATDLESAVGPDHPEPASDDDARRRTLRAIAVRQGQFKFRRELLAAYSGRCAVTGCTVTALLEAAHIRPYRGAHTNHVTNGLLLRADLHTLFDLGLLRINPTSFTVELSTDLSGSEYECLAGKTLRLPASESSRPDVASMAARYEAPQA